MYIVKFRGACSLAPSTISDCFKLLAYNEKVHVYTYLLSTISTGILCTCCLMNYVHVSELILITIGSQHVLTKIHSHFFEFTLQVAISTL